MTTQTNGTLLIIDDIPENVKVLLNFLIRQGFKILATKEGEQGIKVAKNIHPDLILLDVMMPGMNGFEVCKILKADKSTQNIPIIFMTALTDMVDKVKGFELGAADYITKPVHHEEVLVRIHSHLKLRRLQQQLEEQNELLLYEIRLRKEVEASLQYTNNVLVEQTLELQAKTFELEQRNTELDAFAHTVAHDLKTPLTGIIGITELMKESCEDSPPVENFWREQLHLLDVAAHQMNSIIDGLLLLAGVCRQENLTIQSLDMRVVVEEVLEGQAFIIKKYHAEVCLPSHWPAARGFAPWVKEIWVNYLTNALKYGGRPPRLELGAESQVDGMIRFWLRDNGLGLTPEAQTQLFTPFNRLHCHRVEGHGLGLSIVKHIVEKLGGQVGVESSLQEGSLFYFTLPTS